MSLNLIVSDFFFFLTTHRRIKKSRGRQCLSWAVNEFGNRSLRTRTDRSLVVRSQELPSKYRSKQCAHVLHV